MSTDQALRHALKMHDLMEEDYSKESQERYLEARGHFRKLLLDQVSEEVDGALAEYQTLADELQEHWELLEQYAAFFKEHRLPAKALEFLKDVKLPRGVGFSSEDRSTCAVVLGIQLSDEAEQVFTDRWERECEPPTPVAEYQRKWELNHPLGR